MREIFIAIEEYSADSIFSPPKSYSEMQAEMQAVRSIGYLTDNELKEFTGRVKTKFDFIYSDNYEFEQFIDGISDNYEVEQFIDGISDNCADTFRLLRVFFADNFSDLELIDDLCDFDFPSDSLGQNYLEQLGQNSFDQVAKSRKCRKNKGLDVFSEQLGQNSLYRNSFDQVTPNGVKPGENVAGENGKKNETTDKPAKETSDDDLFKKLGISWGEWKSFVKEHCCSVDDLLDFCEREACRIRNLRLDFPDGDTAGRFYVWTSTVENNRFDRLGCYPIDGQTGNKIVESIAIAQKTLFKEHSQKQKGKKTADVCKLYNMRFHLERFSKRRLLLFAESILITKQRLSQPEMFIAADDYSTRFFRLLLDYLNITVPETIEQTADEPIHLSAASGKGNRQAVPSCIEGSEYPTATTIEQKLDELIEKNKANARFIVNSLKTEQPPKKTIDEETQEMLELLENGYTVAEIKRQYHLSESAVYKRIERYCKAHRLESPLKNK